MIGRGINSNNALYRTCFTSLQEQIVARELILQYYCKIDYISENFSHTKIYFAALVIADKNEQHEMVNYIKARPYIIATEVRVNKLYTV